MIYIPTRFEKLMHEHETIQANVRLISGLADDLIALSNLKESFTDFSPYQLNYLGDKRLNFKRAIGSLKDGLLDHHNREEEIIRPLLGKPLMKAIKKDCQDILEKLIEIDWILLNTSPAGILFNSAFIKFKVDAMCQRLIENCRKKDSILELLIKTSAR
jgi:hypothetical protein